MIRDPYYTTAFSTIDHKIVLSWLKDQSGINGKALRCLMSLLLSQSQRTVVGNCSLPSELSFVELQRAQFPTWAFQEALTPCWWRRICIQWSGSWVFMTSRFHCITVMHCTWEDLKRLQLVLHAAARLLNNKSLWALHHSTTECP